MKRFPLLTIFLVILSGVASPAPPERIVSLAPSITEILYALGLEDRIVAVTNVCDYPPGAKEKPKIGGMSNPSLEAVVSARPDIVVMTTDGNPKEFQERLEQLGINTHVFRARRLSELPDEIRKLGAVLRVKEKADSLAEEIEDAINRYKSEIRNQKSEIRKALFIIWPEPLIVAGPGTAIDDALKLLGWENIASDAEAKYPKYSIEEVIHRAPDVILIGKGHVSMKDLSGRLLRRLNMLDAVRKGRVYYTGDALYRLGPRVVEGIEEIAGFLKDNDGNHSPQRPQRAQRYSGIRE